MRFEGGRVLAQSNLIIGYIAENTEFIPTDPFERARMYDWLFWGQFWEQYSHEPYIAVRRYQQVYLKKQPEELDPRLFERGSAALARMEAGLDGRDRLAGDRHSLADVALVAYTRMARSGGFDLGLCPRVSAWVDRVERALDLDASTRDPAPD